MKILDSDILIDFLKNKEKAVEKIQSLIDASEELMTTVFNQQEVYYGVLKEKAENRFNTAQDFFKSLNVLDYEKHCIINTLKIQFELEKKGLMIGIFDLLIAGICLTNNAIIVTRNVEHFSRIPMLRVESW